MKNRLVMACCLAILLAGCGAEGDPDRSADPTEVAASPEVEPEEPEEVVAEGTLSVTGGEWNFQSPDEAVAGDLEITFENTGQVTHELILAKLLDGPPLAEIAKLETREEILKKVRELAGTGRVFTGETSKTLKVDLKPGAYGLLCLLESPRGRTHAWVGMFAELSVT
jgi:hypothetical protein